MMSFQNFISEQEQGDIARYIEYKAAMSNIDLDEAANRSLGRLFGQIQNGNTIVIITAFRSERSLAANRNLNKQLAADIRQLGWGYTPVLGGFMEKVKDDQGQEKKVHAHEESFFVNAKGDNKQVLSHVIGLLKKYQQEAALIKLPDNEKAMLLFPSGETTVAGAWHADPQMMATYYTRMRKSNRQFTFEAAGDDSIMTRRAVESYFASKS